MMTSKESVELVIHTSHLIQSAAGLIGVTDVVLARIHVEEIVKATIDLDKFLDKCETL